MAPILNKIRSALTAPSFLRCVTGYTYFHFGFLKFFPDLSPAELLAEQTIIRLSSGLIDADLGLRLLAITECTIGLCLLFKFRLNWIFPIFMGHLVFTFAPLFLLPGLCFKFFPLAPTIEGLFILKNLPLFAAAWIVLFPVAFPIRNS
jgi:hypothetical protein